MGNHWGLTSLLLPCTECFAFFYFALLLSNFVRIPLKMHVGNAVTDNVDSRGITLGMGSVFRLTG